MAKKQQTVHQIKILGLNDIKALNVEISKLAGNYDKLGKEGKEASESTKKVGKSSKESKLGIQKLAANALKATAAFVAFSKISKALTAELRKGVEVFKGYEFEMQKVKAISGANTQEFLKLDKSAQKLGRSTFFTAQQVAALQLNFSKLGFTSSEVLQVQEAALTAATATGEDLARTATVIGSTIRGFGLDATEGARVADVMAASFTSSALTLEKFQTSMTKVSPVAKLLGMDLEETTSIMGVLTDAGIEASIAGTSLRNIFLKLGDPSSDLAKSIGFTVNSGEDMVREFRRMKDEGINVEKMLKVVDVRQVAAISTMIEHIDKIESQTESFRASAGAAQDMADIIANSLQGATLRFQSALDGLRIVIVEKFAPSMQKTLDILTNLFNKFASFSEVTMSEELEKDRLKMNALAIQASRLEEGTDKRKKAIERLQRLYPTYFTQLDAEKSKNDELKKSLALANEQYLKRIVLRQKEDKLSKVLSDAQEKDANVTRLQNEFDAEALRLKTKHNLAVELEGKTTSEAFSAIKKAMEDVGLIGKSDLSDPFSLISVTGTKGIKTSAEVSLGALSTASVAMQKNQKDFEDLQTESQKILKDAEDFAKKFGLTMGMDDPSTGTPTGTPKPTGTPAGEEDFTPDEDALKFLKEAVDEAYVSYFKNSKDLENSSRNLYDFQTRLIENLLKDEQLSYETKIHLEKKLIDLKMQNFDKEKAGRQEVLNQMKNLGQTLIMIGEAEGENNKVKQLGIKISQAAAVASSIEAASNAINAITDMAADSPWYLKIANILALVASFASVGLNVKQLVSGGQGELGNGNTETDVKFEQGGLTRGGMFQGNSHANGGVKFRVGGRIHEAEGGEAIINKKSTSMFRPMLSAINSYNGNGVKFADGGLLNSGEKFAMGGELRSAQQLVSGGIGSSKVVIVESDMTDVQNRISAIESQATF